LDTNTNGNAVNHVTSFYTTNLSKFCILHLIGYFEVRDIDISLQIVKVMNFDIFLQIVQLTASGNFEEALSLCKLLPPEESSLRAAKEGSIHIRLFTIVDYSF
jgi:hypothetical protein